MGRGAEVFFRRRRTVDQVDNEPIEPLDAVDEAGDEDDEDEGDYLDAAIREHELPGSGGDDELIDVVNPNARPVERAAVEATTGPWDFHDRPRDDDVPRVDLGGIRLPVPNGVELRVEIQDDIVIAATLVDGASQLLVHAFAAPKSSGIWPEVRREIVESLQQNGGGGQDRDGAFGAELEARIPAENGTQPARFLGVDGPRWFLRGLVTGPAATDPNQGRRLEDVFRQTVVNRGIEAMAPREPLPLHLPRDIIEATEPAEESQAAGQPAPQLQLRERGPEITEIQ